MRFLCEIFSLRWIFKEFYKFHLMLKVLMRTQSGTFSVRLVYHRKLEHHYGLRLVSDDGQGNAHLNPVYKNSQNLRLPRKIKHFLWKVVRGALPCYGILPGRHILCTPQCLDWCGGHSTMLLYPPSSAGCMDRAGLDRCYSISYDAS